MKYLKCTFFLHFNIFFKSSLCPFQFSPISSLVDYCCGLANQIQLLCSWRVLAEPSEHWWRSLFLQGNLGPWIMRICSVLFCLRASSSSCPVTHTGGAWPSCRYWGGLSLSSSERGLKQGAPITDPPHLRVLEIWKDHHYAAFPWMSALWQGHLKFLTMRFP